MQRTQWLLGTLTASMAVATVAVAAPHRSQRIDNGGSHVSASSRIKKPTTAGNAAGKDNGTARAIGRTDVPTFEVGGLKLGMSADEVERVAGAKNLRTGMMKRLRPFDDAPDGDRMPSFDTMAANMAADRLNAKRPAPMRILAHVVLKGEDGSRYDIRFFPMEQGPTLSSLTFFTSMNGNSAATYLAALKERYGPPTRSGIGGSGFSASWCARVDPTCQTSPNLQVVSDGAEVTMHLETGYLRRKALDQRIKAKAAAIAATGASKPVF